MQHWSSNKQAFLSDLSQVTKAFGYWQDKSYQHQAVFHLYFQQTPFPQNYAISPGLNAVIPLLQNLKVSVDEIQYLAALKGDDGYSLFSESFLNYLQRLEFNCDIDAIPEGEIVFPYEPVIRVKGPLLQAQLIETVLLNQLHFSDLITTERDQVSTVQPASFGCVYELSALKTKNEAWIYDLNLLGGKLKTSAPGILQIKRFYKEHIPIGDMIYDLQNDSKIQEMIFQDKIFHFENMHSKNLLVPIFRNGKCIYTPPNFEAIQLYCKAQLAIFSELNLEEYPIGLEKSLHHLKRKMMNDLS